MSGLRQFSVDNWCAWAPGLATAEDWQTYFNAPYTLPDDERADVSFLPAMQRRRLSPLARAAFYASYHCLNGDTCCPAIYCSTYGEYQRADAILHDIAGHHDMSPTAFGLSVHNAIAGQSSILFGNKEPIIAISPSEQSYLSAFVDALGHLHDGKSSVLLVFYEEKAPDFFAPYCFSTDYACALAVRIRLPRPDDQHYQLDFSGAQEQAEHHLPDLLKLIRFFAENRSQLQLGCWQLS